MKPWGEYIQPGGVKGICIRTTYYALRYNHRYEYLSVKPLGLQALILFLGTYLWVNIPEYWIINKRSEL